MGHVRHGPKFLLYFDPVVLYEHQLASLLEDGWPDRTKNKGTFLQNHSHFAFEFARFPLHMKMQVVALLQKNVHGEAERLSLPKTDHGECCIPRIPFSM